MSISTNQKKFWLIVGVLVTIAGLILGNILTDCELRNVPVAPTEVELTGEHFELLPSSDGWCVAAPEGRLSLVKTNLGAGTVKVEYTHDQRLPNHWIWPDRCHDTYRATISEDEWHRMQAAARTLQDRRPNGERSETSDADPSAGIEPASRK